MTKSTSIYWSNGNGLKMNSLKKNEALQDKIRRRY